VTVTIIIITFLTFITIVCASYDLEKQSRINLSFEFDNGLVGVKRYRFSLVIGYQHLDPKDRKTKNI
jgi:hypothetical protein